MRRLALATPVALALALAGAASAHARPRLSRFACAFGDGRTHVMTPRRVEADSDDELLCRVELTGVTAATVERLAGELRASGPGGRVRRLAVGDFDVREDRYRRAEIDLIAPHEVWFPSVDWRAGRRPRLHLVVTVFDKRGSARPTRWLRLVLSRKDVGHLRVRAGTPSHRPSFPEYAPQLFSQATPRPRPRPKPTTVARQAPRQPIIEPAPNPYDDSNP
jgi:hypothetical protein